MTQVDTHASGLHAFLHTLGSTPAVEGAIASGLHLEVLEHATSLDKAHAKASTIADFRERSDAMRAVDAQRDSPHLFASAVKVQSAFARISPAAAVLAIDSETMPVCPQCNRRGPIEFENEFLGQLSQMFGDDDSGVCGCCLSDRFKVTSPSALAPKSASRDDSTDADLRAQDSRARRVILSECLGTIARAEAADERTFGASSCRSQQDQVREARYQVHLLHEAVASLLAQAEFDAERADAKDAAVTRDLAVRKEASTARRKLVARRKAKRVASLAPVPTASEPEDVEELGSDGQREDRRSTSVASVSDGGAS